MKGKDIRRCKGKLFHTNILDSYSDAAYVEVLQRTTQEETNGKSNIMLIKDSEYNPLYMLKKIVCKAKEYTKIRQAKLDFDIDMKISLRHPNIAKALELKTYLDEEDNTTHIETLFEYGNNINLEETGENGEKVIDTIIQTIDGMKFAHSKGVYHSNLNPDSFITKGRLTKICNFRTSISLQGLSEYFKEMIEKVEKTENFPRDKLDVFLWGLTLYHIISKKTGEQIAEELKQYRQNEETFAEFKAELKKLKLEGVDRKVYKKVAKMLSLCIACSPEKIPSFEELSVNWVPKLKPSTEKDIYVGEIKNGNRRGQGVLYFSNGDIYEGSFKNGKRTGQG